jgi:hypothetical protein
MPKGVPRTGRPNKVSSDVKGMILQALSMAGGATYLHEQSKKNAPAFMRLVGQTLPLTHRIEQKMPTEAELAVMTPLDMLRWTMRAVMSAAMTDPSKLSLLVDAANKAAAYEHPKLAAVEHRGSISLDDLGPDQLRQLAVVVGEAIAAGQDPGEAGGAGGSGEDPGGVPGEPLRLH